MAPARPWERGTEPKAATCPNLSDLDKAVVSDHVPPRPPCFPFRPHAPFAQASARDAAAPSPPQAKPSRLHSEAHLRAPPKPLTYTPVPHPTLPQSPQLSSTCLASLWTVG